MILVIASYPRQTTIAPIQVHMWATLVPQLVKNLPAIQETQVWFLGWGNPLEKGMATHSSILTWRIPWTEEQGRLQSMGSQRVRNDWAKFTFSFKSRYRQNIYMSRMYSDAGTLSMKCKGTERDFMLMLGFLCLVSCRVLALAWVTVLTLLASRMDLSEAVEGSFNSVLLCSTSYILESYLLPHLSTCTRK